MQLNELIKRLKDEQDPNNDLIVQVEVNGIGYEIVEVVDDRDDEYVKLKTRRTT